MPANILLNKFLVKFVYFLICISIFSSVIFLLFLAKKNFTIRQIEVAGDSGRLMGLEKFKDRNIFITSDSEIRNLVLTDNPIISSVEVRKQLPDKIFLTVKKFHLIAALVVSEGYYHLSEDGRVLSKVKNIKNNLPKVNFYQLLAYQSYQPGDTIKFREIKDGLYFLKELTDIGEKVDSLDINGINMIVLNLENRKLIFSSDKSKESQIFQVKEIIRKFKLEGRYYKEIDLRFDKPVVRF
ncbi:hypothetical protein B6D29_01680 [Microgenomates bacterium UTCPR1]|nr:MAG: hypothetical protein B6D29_01680 [Microgenomates bacterium UTCPR1]